jgi:hypothetical protein
MPSKVSATTYWIHLLDQITNIRRARNFHESSRLAINVVDFPKPPKFNGLHWADGALSLWSRKYCSEQVCHFDRKEKSFLNCKMRKVEMSRRLNAPQKF